MTACFCYFAVRQVVTVFLLLIIISLGKSLLIVSLNPAGFTHDTKFTASGSVLVKRVHGVVVVNCHDVLSLYTFLL